MTLRHILEPLLAGEFICSISHAKLYQQLQDEEIRIEINNLLRELGKQLWHTQDHEAYYCAYTDLRHTQDMRQVRNQFEMIRDQIAPVLHFLTLQMKVEGRDIVLIMGETIRFHDLLSSIEQEPAYLNDLKLLGRYELFKKIRNRQSTKERLMAVLETLEKEGYINLSNSESDIYQVTGKIEYFYSCLEFIKDHEQLPLEEEEEDQRGLKLDN